MKLFTRNNFIILVSVILYLNGSQSFKIEQDSIENKSPAENVNSKKQAEIDNSNESVLKNEQNQQLELLQQQQRFDLKEFVEALLSTLKNNNKLVHDGEDLNEIDLLNEPEMSSSELDESVDVEDDDSLLSQTSKRSANRFKKEFEEKRNKSIRRQQAAKWDIGFGKRASPNLASYHIKPKSFLDALYGKRSAKNNKVTFGRKQQWDIRYGK